MPATEIQSATTIVGHTNHDLKALCRRWEQPLYRGDQLFHWIYTRRATSFQAMDNLPLTFRQRLAETYSLRTLTLAQVTESASGATGKYLFATAQDDYLETVLIRDGVRRTLCVSSQIGCALDCSFCATASMGFHRNLSTGEIVEQYLQVRDRTSQPITNIVFMGMGEPFLNYSRVVQAAALFNAREGINISARRITVSTAGIVPQIRRFTQEGQRYKLAVSLNASTEEQRTRLMPVNSTHSLADLIAAAGDYAARSRNRITFEYVLLKNTNDHPQDARRLKRLLSGFPCKLNLIPYNEIGGIFLRPTTDRIDAFLAELADAPFPVTVRWSGGDTIGAGCGQLAVETTP